jgi:hypothetical protein
MHFANGKHHMTDDTDPSTEPKNIGRPSGYTDEIAEKILDRISEGEMLTKICQEDGMPPRKTVYTWMRARAAFKAAYATAREEWAEFYEEKVLEIAFNDRGDIFIENGKAVADHARVQRARLQVDTLKWFMMKWAPRRYGLEPDAQPAGPKQITFSFDEGITRTIVDPPNPLKERIRELEEQLGLRPGPPKQLTFDPGALPQALDDQIKNRALRLIKDAVPSTDQREPAAIIDEVFAICQSALRLHFREVTAETSSA